MPARPGKPNVYAALEPIVPAQRPAPPPELTPEEAREWSRITASVPAEWLGAENAPLFVLLVRHVMISRELWAEISAVRARLRGVVMESTSEIARMSAVGAGRKELYALMREHRMESQRIGDLSTKLRLTNQSRASAYMARTQAARAGTSARRPWDGDDAPLAS
jgi:adenylosuccinate lyase